eukprot:15332682-Ditylum_brightwellii.AAC.1
MELQVGNYVREFQMLPDGLPTPGQHGQHTKHYKFIIAVYGDKVTKACGIHQLCSGLKASIEGAVHSMKQMWDDHAKEDGWEILLALEDISSLWAQRPGFQQGGSHTRQPTCYDSVYTGSVTSDQNDSTLAGFFEAIGKWYDKLCLIGPPLGYHPELEKSIFITQEKNVELA